MGETVKVVADAAAADTAAVDKGVVADTAAAGVAGAVDEGAVAETPTTGEKAVGGAVATDTIVVADSPEDWRQEDAGGDEKVLKRLERYASRKAVAVALIAAQAKISSGELKTPLKANATAEEVAEWREANGVPASPDKYEVTPENGGKFEGDDKTFVDGFLKVAHTANMSQAQVNELLSWRFAEQEKVKTEQESLDTEFRQQADDALRAEWGVDYRRNLQLANSLLDLAPEGTKDRLLQARLSDGTPLGDDPAVLGFLVHLAREINPVATVVPGSGANAATVVDSELGNLRKLMGDTKSEYWKGPNAAKNQTRYRDLLTAVEKQQARG